MNKKFRKQLEGELQKNKAINQLQTSNHDSDTDFDFTDTSLQLGDKNIKDVAFLGKVMERFDDLQVLDLSHN